MTRIQWCVSVVHAGVQQWWTGTEWSGDLELAKLYPTKAKSDAIAKELQERNNYDLPEGS